MSNWDAKTFKFRKTAKASFCTPKTTFSAVPKGEHSNLTFQHPFSDHADGDGAVA